MPYSVMLVDNEPAIPRGLMQLIDWNACGCRVSAIASDGLDAVRKIREMPPDILISDIRMPEMSGLELCAWTREHYPNIQMILLTGFPDFEYAQQAIQYQVVDFVLKPTTENALIAALRKAGERLKKETAGADNRKSLILEQQMLLSELIYKNRHSFLYTLNRLNEMHIVLTGFYVLCLDVLLQNEKQPDPDSVLAQAQEVLLRCSGGNPVYFVPKSDCCCYAILCLPEGEDPFSICSAATEAADRKTDFILTIGISRHHGNPLHLQAAAREADDAQQFTRYSSQPSVMRCENLPCLSEETARRMLEKLRLVESALENRSYEATVRHLDGFFDFLHDRKLPFSSIYQMTQLLYNFCVSLLLSYNLSSGNPPQRVSDLRGQTPGALEEELRGFLLETLDRISKTPGNIDNLIYTLKQYIDQNYPMDLSLDTLATQVHLSPSYLSKLFKKEMGENLSTYILNTRIQHAKLLLRTTDKKAYEIAEAVGIYDPVYFSKIFKKTTGFKPKEYRDAPEEPRRKG